jgi:hypothetical protein
MKFDSALHLIAEASQETIKKLDSMEEYFDAGGFKEIYPQERKKYIDHVRRENYFYKRKDGNYYALLIVLKSNTYDEDKDNMVKIIKDLSIIQDNKAEVKRIGIIIKVMIKDKQII